MQRYEIKLYVRLQQANLLSKYSPKDIIEKLKAIHKVRIRGVWKLTEMTENTKRLFKKLKIDDFDLNIGMNQENG
jgi:hypothetical protein